MIDLQSQEPHTPGLGRVHIMPKCAVSWSNTKAPSIPTAIHKEVSPPRLMSPA